MSLIKSISGIRGTIGGQPGSSLTPVDLVSFTSAYGQWMMSRKTAKNGARYCVVVGRDARISGKMVDAIVCNTLLAMGIDVINAGLATTPTVEMAVTQSRADGGIILTASHNPAQWNALKLLNGDGEFLSGADGEALLAIADQGGIHYADVHQLGSLTARDFLPDHISAILNLPEVNKAAIRARKFKVVLDAVNSVGGIAVPQLLEALGVELVAGLNCQPDGHFAHNPEPLPAHLTEICEQVSLLGADLGIVVDPDVDRLALINEDGSFFGEEYTLVAVADYLLRKTPGNTVSNLSSSRALRDVTQSYGGIYQAAAVGEVNVVQKMKEIGALIGGEGNGGVIFPALHYGRDALVGIALFLSHLAEVGVAMKALRASYPSYFMSKNKIQLGPEQNPDGILEQMQKIYQEDHPITVDGVKIDFEKSWVHLRKSNTEPIIRIYSEAPTQVEADELAQKMLDQITGLE